MKNFETLEVDKTYKNRIGGLIKIIKIDYNDPYHPFFGDNDRYYTPYGNYVVNDATPHELDLIELIEDKLTIERDGQDAKPLTIDEINAIIAELEELRKELDKSVEVGDDFFSSFISTRLDGKYKNIGFWLNPTYNWELVADEHKCLVLVPTKKK